MQKHKIGIKNTFFWLILCTAGPAKSQCLRGSILTACQLVGKVRDIDMGVSCQKQGREVRSQELAVSSQELGGKEERSHSP